jgi:aminoglycoside phosphotransferase (APT) family kinase protein
MIATTSDPAFTDAPLVLMTYVDGVVVDDVAAASELSTERRRAIGLSLPQALGAIHGVDLAAVGLDDLASKKPYAARQLKRWTSQWEHSKTRDITEITDVAEALADNAPEQSEVTLVHGDYYMSNVITSADTGDVIGVVDWELCTLGEPLADLGNLLAFWPEVGDGVAGPFTAPTLAGFPPRSELVAGYAAATGRDVTDVGYWHTLALWRLTIIAEGVRRRLLNDPRNASRDGGPTDKVIDDLVVRTVQVGRQSGIL